ncbi:hypothetical protein [Rugosimonospora africana]|uniref:Uncharacterized protein n=1 Tax=Rugosimonospora africana TaxID=556532 RepID=A0A8J3R6J1_9ACTN|nr:hypothetical protein [Rugosimonospora africana]GIH20946.1 hypothetical protein Raf01_91180 [Rugosimonospora africana]
MRPSRAELVDQLLRILDIRLLDPMEILLDDGPTGTGASRGAGGGSASDGGASGAASSDAVGALRILLRRRVETWARQMTGDDDQAAIRAVMRVMSTLYPADGPFEPPVDWWASPLGQVLAYRVGHPTAQSVPYPVAGAMLGITRQGVHDLVSRGKLARHPQGGVVPDSIRTRLLQGEPR